ncbi:bifunctional diaminohydroxyphosphoribosylaminopyrimidine deaminase/5-amino-6-(5-phosphoribosylamino)uracil reductase RibD [Coraliomargarita sinensis]|uniref:Riboflavin biosynthesis protein RibD n=1 Tax=Coraliomargarita sinensis TaxID=2174842 RepID=A0A317ZF82_9BACT|nr:bifunctional diaminohydroxyphosphoribosylaminopyrimidine deaminase/5-amino-6-(5-phosphoribosylamino)uracil reductase RibD [Coraliomargarita sinensis]PXA04106.1 bifunctional diaminohydroxyphosphoribosylaminopyrimidine deaminase/5-amino-6-(5-phosphoribosylamino)uracil reductase RibD [Coraliomargarita sinensis]
MSYETSRDAFYMARAIELAGRAWGQTHPNPMVGALIVENRKVVAEGWHKGPGQPHAEIEALKALDRKRSQDAALYVTLEPCSTEGRTGACTRAIIESGIRKVVVGAIDPNPDHAGRGLEILKNAGIEVSYGTLEEECSDLNLIFNHWITTAEPLLAAKLAMTLDGKFAAASGHSQWVTAEAARDDVMHWRRYFPAIAVGANTVLQDDPSLTSRMDDAVFCPRRFVFDRHLKTMAAQRMPKLYSDQFKEQTCVLCLKSANAERKAAALDAGVGVWELPEDRGHIDWTAFRERCAAETVCGVYIECGPALATEVIENKKADYLFIYKAPKFMADSATPGIGSRRATASMSDALHLENVHHEILGDDVLTRGRLLR